MRKFLLVLILSGIFAACKKHKDVISSPPPPPPPQAVLLNDIVHVSVPSSYYHFEYDFDLIDDFFDHFFLPGVQLQKNNPGKQTFTGDAGNHIVDCTCKQIGIAAKQQTHYRS